MSGPLGVLVMAYGTPRRLEDLETFYTHIRRGRPPTPELLAELRARYEAIGGVSPLAAATEAQRAAIESALSARAPDGVVATVGMKHAEPFIEDAVAALADRGIRQIVGLVLAPHYAAASVGQYRDRAAAAALARGLDFRCVESWHLEPAYLDFLAAAVREGRRALPARTKVLFSAHSLPERVLEGDPYPEQLRDSATAVAERAGMLPWSDWTVVWQSAGRTPEPWRGPDVLDVIRTLAETGRCEGVLVCPHGFCAEHLEVRYDLDIEARGVAERAGLAFARTPTVGAEPTVMAALAERVLALAGLSDPSGHVRR